MSSSGRARLFGSFLALAAGCGDPPGDSQVFAENHVVDAGSVETFTPPRPLRVVGWFSDVCIAPAAPVVVEVDSFALRTRDSTTFAPTVSVISPGGEVVELTMESVLLGQPPSLCFGEPAHRFGDEYTTITIASPQHLPIARAWWISTDK